MSSDTYCKLNDSSMALTATGQPRTKRYRQLPIVAAMLSLLCLPTPLYAFDFSLWDAILKKNTRPSNSAGIGYTGFDYANVLGSNEFDKLIANLESFSPEKLSGRDETLSFWINVYNIFAVKMALDHFPVKGIKDAGSFFFPVWVLSVGKVGGKMYSLSGIEHKILRPMNEPAIHFAIVCASVSCPDLRPEPYTASALREQLKSQINRFLENKSKGVLVDHGKKTAHLSMIFDWYEKDFEVAGGVTGFINRELGGHQAIPQNYAIKHMPYNWDLNIIR